MSITYYEKHTPEGSDITYYRHLYRVTEHYLPVLNLAIAVNNATGEKHLLVEPNDFFADKKLYSIFWHIKISNEVGQFYYDSQGPSYDYEFAIEIFKYLDFEFIEMNYCGIPLFDKRRADVFIQTFNDFHKIVSGEMNL
jgi:hypothetical protein